MPCMSDEPRRGPSRAEELREDSNKLLAGGAALGTFAAVSSALLGATCPMCIVVAPLMLGAGAVQRWRCVRAERAGLERGQPDDADVSQPGT